MKVFSPPDACFTYKLETDKVFDLRAGLTTPLHKRPLNDNAPVSGRALPAHAVCFVVEWLNSMENATARILSSHVFPGSASGAHVGNCQYDTLTPFHDNNDAGDSAFYMCPLIFMSMLAPSLSRLLLYP